MGKARYRIAGGAVAIALVLLGLAAGRRAFRKDADPTATTAPPITPSTGEAARKDQPGFLYGRITTSGGVTHEGRLRWGGGQEAFWGDYFNGVKSKNLWVAQVPPERVPKERSSIGIFGLELIHKERPVDLGRLFMARFGDIARIEADGTHVRVTLKSGTVFNLNRMDASDFDDGVRLWGTAGVVDFDSLQIHSIELLPTPPLDFAADRLHGTVHTQQGDFTGFVQWDREKCVGTDELGGHDAKGEVSLRFDTIRSIAHRPRNTSLVTLLDGRELVLSGGNRNRGLYVDDQRYGRVLISWDAFERIDFSPDGSGPAYGDFPPGRPLKGSVTTRDGHRLAGRLVYDLDESETTETFDAPSEGVDYTIPFGLIASIVPRGGGERGVPRGRVSLRDGEQLQLERAGDLGDGNAGLLIFVDEAQRPEYVSWADVERVDFDR
jgi:hypothetical protein